MARYSWGAIDLTLPEIPNDQYCSFFFSFLNFFIYPQFKLSAKELDGRTLWASVWDNARLSHNTFMGEIRLDLAGVDFTVPTQKTFNLQEKVWCLGFYFHVVVFSRCG